MPSTTHDHDRPSQAENSELIGNDAPFTAEELSLLEEFTNPHHLQLGGLDLSNWDTGIQDPQFQQSTS